MLSFRRVAVALAALAISVFSLAAHAAPVDPWAANSLWVAADEGIMRISSVQGDLLLEIPEAQNARTIDVDLRRGIVWAFARRTLYAYDFGGHCQLAVPVSTSDTVQAAMAVSLADGAVWLGVGHDLLNVGASGQPLNSLRLAGNVVALEADPARSLLWVATGSSVEVLDLVSAAVVRRLELPANAQVVGVGFEQAQGSVWVALQDEVRRYAPNGDLVLSKPLAGATQIAADLAEGAWVTTATTVMHLSSTGAVLSTTTPFDGAGVIGRMASAGDFTVWVATQGAIAHLSPTGAVLQRLSFQPPARIRDLAVNSDAAAPEVSVTAPSAGACLADLTPTLELAFQDPGWGIAPDSFEVSVNGTVQPVACSATPERASCEFASPLAEGLSSVTVTVQDFAGNRSAPATTEFTVDGTAPVITVTSPADGAVADEQEVTLQGSLSESATLTINGTTVEVGSDHLFNYAVQVAEGENPFELSARDCAGNQKTLTLHVTYRPDSDPEFPPDPATVATPVDPVVASDIAAATAFLYSGPDPIQEGVSAGTIDPHRIAVLRGRVIDRDGNPIPGVDVTILNHPEFGRTASREDGLFDIAVNGGGTLTVSYSKNGFFPAQRPVEAPWRDYAWLEDLALIRPDGIFTVVTSGAPSIQVARGSEVQDQDGSRRPTLLFQPGTSAEMVLPDGTRQQLASLTVRATEYTVGPQGPAAMPGPLPAGVAYTHAVELNADEAMAADAKTIVFSKPVIYYVENFLGFPVGGSVPVGYYDRRLGAWLPADNGRIVRVLATTNGIADLDVVGSGTPADQVALAALGISEEERRHLAALYSSGQALWRVPIPHFTPWDCNWPYGPPDDAEPPGQPEPETDDPEDDPCQQPGSIIECQNQTLGESLPLTGTPFSLSYRSDRSPGRKGNRSIEVALTGPSVPASVKRVDLKISVAGRIFESSFSRQPNQHYRFSWDGKDAYGRLLNGRQPVKVEIGYVYEAVYQSVSIGGQAWGQRLGAPITGSRVRQEVTLWQVSHQHIGSWMVPPSDFGGWSVSPYHYYDNGGTHLFFGTGDRLHAGPASQVITTVLAGSGLPLNGGPGTPVDASLNNLGIAIAADGSLYIADTVNRRIRKLASDGTLSTAAGGGGVAGDGIPATQALLGYPVDVAAGPDGSIYLLEKVTNSVTSQGLVRRVDPRGRISTVYSHGASSTSYGGIDVDREGNLYVADAGRNQIVRVDLSGRHVVMAGTGAEGSSGDGGLATSAALEALWDVVVDRQGAIYVVENRNSQVLRNGVWEQPRAAVRRVAPNGIISTFRGGRPNCYYPHTSGAWSAGTGFLCVPRGLAVGPDDSLYVSDNYSYWESAVRRISPEGIMTTVAGGSDARRQGDFASATGTYFLGITGVAVSPQGLVHISEISYGIRRAGFALPGYSLQPITVASRNGRELFLFDANGRHLKTVDTLTGHIVFEFLYDAAKRLVGIKDANHQLTQVERNASGGATAIVSPFGVRTTLGYDSNGYLASVRNPAGETVRLSHDADGLLTALTDPRDGRHEFSYDSFGRLATDKDPADAEQTLTRTSTAAGYRIDLRSAEGRYRRYGVDELPTGERNWTITLPSGNQSSTLFKPSGTSQITRPDGTVITTARTPDPRFGMQSAMAGLLQVRTPSGLTRTSTLSATAVLDNPLDPLSLRTLQQTAVQNGRTFSRRFDTAARQFTFTSAEGRQRSITVDAQGRPAQVFSPGVAVMTLAYNPQGRLAEIRQGTGIDERRLVLGYDAQGRLSSTTDHLGRTRTRFYDDADRLTTRGFEDGRSISYRYDASGNLTAVTPPGGVQHAFESTLVGLPDLYTPPSITDGGPTDYSYSLDRQLTSITRAGGEVISVQYDTAGRIAQTTLPEGDYRYTRSPSSGALTSITAPGGEGVSFTYDGILATRASWTGPVTGTVDRAYDANFWRKSDSVNGGSSISYTYDKDGLLKNAGALVIARDTASGRVTGTTLGSVTTSVGYTSFGEVASAIARFQGANIASFVYERDPLGRVAAVTETMLGTTRRFTYHYDPANRLAAVEVDGAALGAYTFDANGRRTSAVGPAGPLSASFDAQDRLLQQGDETFEYRASGELRRRSFNGHHVDYSYDAFGNLRTVTMPDGLAIDYVIDGRNRRVGKRVGGVLVKGWLFDNQLRPLAELDGAGGITSRFVYGTRLNVPEYLVRGGATYRIVTDHLGSPRLVVAVTDGAIAQRLDYDAFGKVVLDTNPGFQPFGFAGGLYDHQTGLVRFGARDYDPSTGRWTTKDPLLFGGGDTNLYSYALADPVNIVDVNGLNPAVNVGGRLATAGGAAAADGPVPVGDVIAVGILIWTLWDVLTNDQPEPIDDPWQRLGPDETDAPPAIPFPGWDPTVPPGPSCEWKGKGKPGGPQGNWHDPNTGESWHPDLDHPAPIGPHWDYKDPSGNSWRIDPNGVVTPK